MTRHNISHTHQYCKKANKKILVDRVQAELFLEHIQLNARRTIHDECRSYPCQFGNHWHVTSESQRSKIQDIPYSA